jgi:hypothetical protein
MKWRCFEDGAETKMISDHFTCFVRVVLKIWFVVVRVSDIYRHKYDIFFHWKISKLYLNNCLILAWLATSVLFMNLPERFRLPWGGLRVAMYSALFWKKKHHNLINWKTVDRQWQFSKVTTHFWIKDSHVNIESAVFFSILQRKVLMSISFRKTLRAMFMNITVVEYLQVLSWLSQLRFLQLRQKHPHHSLLQE